MSDQAELTGRIFFANPTRNLSVEQKTNLRSIGIDIGSTTTHLIISDIRLEQEAGKYVVADRGVFFESEIILTPYSGNQLIDVNSLRRFIHEQFRWAGVSPADIDTGAVIMTGVALMQKNARAIGDLFSLETGNFVSVSAGDRLEAALSAFGSGAVTNSQLTGATIMNIDIGGGTTKISICRNGKIMGVTALEIGARLISWDQNWEIRRLDKTGEYFADKVGANLSLGSKASKNKIEKIASQMTEVLFAVISQQKLEDEIKNLHRIAPLDWRSPIDAITFSGGVAEYFYGYGSDHQTDMGAIIAASLRDKLAKTNFTVKEPVESIRATVIGASQYSSQLSGTTVFISPMESLPLRNIPVIRPALSLGTGPVEENLVSKMVHERLAFFGLETSKQAVAICFEWEGSATFERINSFLKGVIIGMNPVLSGGRALILISTGDIGRIFGRHAREELLFKEPIVSIDSIDLAEFDYIDIGSPLSQSAAVPIVIKSLLFS